MCIDIGEAKDSAAALESQVRFILDQENNETPARYLQIRCGCLKLVKMKYAYRCLYCGVFYCRDCAEQHFGKTIAQYREERDT